MDPTPLSTPAIADLLNEIGQRMELGGESPFKARAYFRAAESLLSLTEPLPDLIAKGKLKTIPNVGDAIAEKISKLYRTGTHPTLEFLREQHPAGLLEMLRIPGLGTKKVLLLYEELKIASVAELEDACKAGKLRDCKGLGAKTEMKILQQIEFMRKGMGCCLLHVAEERVLAACERLKRQNPQWKSVVPAGEFRRSCEVVNDVCVVAQNGNRGEIDGEDHVRIVESDAGHYGAALLFATGSEDHLSALTELAKAKGMALSAKGLTKSGKELPCATEQEIYSALGLPFIEPELREGLGEIEKAQKGALPKLVSAADIRGVLHSHTDYSDGSQTLEQMADAVLAKGFEYYGVADHSQSAAYAGGLKEDRVAAQQKLADELNRKYQKKKFRIFKGIESDIKDDGSLDYPESVLEKFDFIVASVHSRFTLDKATQTKRVIKAVTHPRTTILGHMTGRLLLRREGYLVEIEEVLKACADHGVVVEINANPHRLDVDWRWHQRAMELGCMMSINPDAHSIEELELTKYGIMVARKGGVPPEKSLNCMNLEQITAYFEARKKS